MPSNADEKVAETLKRMPPFVQEGVLVGNGLTTLQSKTIEDANALMQAEPLIRRGLRQFDLRPWELKAV